MGLFDTIFGNKPRTPQMDGFYKTLTAYMPSFTSWGGSIYESELVRAAINARATHISKLVPEFSGSAQAVLKTQLKRSPNEWQTWSQFLYRLSTILDVNNTAFIVPVYNRYGEINGIATVLPSQTQVYKDKDNRRFLNYRFINGEEATIPMSDCAVLTKYQYQDDFFGENNTALAPTMELINIQNQGIAEGVKSAATFRFMAQVNNFSKDSDLAKERKRFNRDNLQGEGGVLLFPNTYSNIQQINSKPYVVDADQMSLINRNVFSYFGVNDDILQNKAFGDAWAAFYEGAIEPFAIQLSDALTKMLFTWDELGYGNKIMFTANRLQYMSNNEKLAVSAQLADRGILNRDEIREIWNLPPIPNGEGQAYIVRGEYKNGNDVNGKDGADNAGKE